MKNNSICSLVICTCDSYQDAWPPLFTLFQRYWPSVRSFPIVLNTETAVYRHDGFDIYCPRLYKAHPAPSTVPWSKRLRETLVQTVHTDLVLLYLDDFYIRSPVNTERLQVCLSLMVANPEIANVCLTPCPQPYSVTRENAWLVKRSKKSPYLFGLQAGLWRKNRLLHFLRDHESPWAFERWGTIRGRRYPDDFYGTAIDNGKGAIFDYCPSTQGVSRGLWLPKTKELFDSEGIAIDTSIRGMMTLGWKPPRQRRNWLKTAWSVFRSLCP